MKNAIVCITGILFIISGCDIIAPEEVYQNAPVSQAAPDSTKPIRKALLEIFTGYKCTNCPAQTKIGLDMIEAANLTKRTVVMKIHQGFFATPDNTFKLDFRTAIGNSLGDQFSINAYPNAVVNRKAYDGSYMVSPVDWSSKISLEKMYANVSVNITKDYNASSRSLNISAIAKLHDNITSPLNIYAYLTEDSIVYLQRDDGPIVNNFVHRHMLRDALIPVDNSNILLNSGANLSSIKKDFSAFNLKPEWNDKHCAVYIVIKDEVSGEVQQVETIEIE